VSQKLKHDTAKDKKRGAAAPPKINFSFIVFLP
jgi:hypothetical protein